MTLVLGSSPHNQLPCSRRALMSPAAVSIHSAKIAPPSSCSEAKCTSSEHSYRRNSGTRTRPHLSRLMPKDSYSHRVSTPSTHVFSKFHLTGLKLSHRALVPILAMGDPNRGANTTTSMESELAPLEGPGQTTLPAGGDFKAQENGARFENVALGGTFDRLHAGHHVLLDAAIGAVKAEGQLIIGVTTEALLQKKVLSELIEPYPYRVAQLTSYILSRAPAVNLKIVPLTEADPRRQPVVDNPILNCIVVSAETEPAARAINEVRKSKGLGVLETVTVGLVGEGSAYGRLSSTEMRERDLGRLLTDKPYFIRGPRLSHKARLAPAHPYTIGLTGGIASGKSSVRKMIEEMLGGGLVTETIDCDALGHLSYLPGTPSFDEIVKAFGEGVVNEDGTINRPALGAVVFGDPAQMAKLTTVAWPSVRRLVDEKREEMRERGVHICVAEAALILESGFEAHMDEVWVVFVPRAIARDRLIARNGLSGEEADKRLDSQMSSAARVARADVALSNAGSLDDTARQLDLAWRLLSARLHTSDAGRSAPNANTPMWTRWMGLMDRLGVGAEVAERWWAVVRGKYSEEGRFYHTMEHVQELYRLCHKYAHFIADLSAVHLAIFFHDVIYDPKCARTGGNEADSAALFVGFAREAGLVTELVEKVEDFILATAGHTTGDAVGDKAWFLDFDLAVLGAEGDPYEKYALDIRKEYAHVPVDRYRKGRAAVLQLFLDSGNIYRTSAFRDSWQAQARRNLEREIAHLRTADSDV